MIETQNYTMTRDEVKVEFAGLAHDHLVASSKMQSARANALHHHHPSPMQQHQASSLPAHNNGHAAGQPTNFGCLNSIRDKTNIIQRQDTQSDSRSSDSSASHSASALSTIAILRRQTMYDSLVLVKKFRPCLNGYTLEFPTSYIDESEHEQQRETICDNKSTENQDLACGRTKLVSIYLDGDDPIYQSQNESSTACNGFRMKPDGGDIVYVPVNGLIDRLNNYDRQGVSIDSRVYAFAMGLKTSERFLTSSSEKEIQEAPPL